MDTTNVMRDVSGRPIQDGDRVLYAKHSGRSSGTLRLGTCRGQTKSGLIRIEILARVWGMYDGKYGWKDGQPKLTTMHYQDRVLVVPQDFKMVRESVV